MKALHYLQRLMNEAVLYILFGCAYIATFPKTLDYLGGGQLWNKAIFFTQIAGVLGRNGARFGHRTTPVSHLLDWMYVMWIYCAPGIAFGLAIWLVFRFVWLLAKQCGPLLRKPARA